MKQGTVQISKEAYDEILAHSRESYPYECCGVLVGNSEEGKRILKSYRTDNTNKERANDRYEIDPREFLRIEKEARSLGRSVIGIYHSHPDHPSRPSVFDRSRGWPEYSYIIIAVKKGDSTEVTSWSFLEENEPFKQEAIEII